MKNFKTISTVVTMAFALAMIAGCNDNGTEPGILDQRLEELKKGNVAWELVSVTKDGYNVTPQFKDFTVKFEDGTYTTQNGVESAWPASGTWEFIDKNPDRILRDKKTEVTLKISNNRLVITFRVTGLSPGGRTTGLDGAYTFTVK